MTIKWTLKACFERIGTIPKNPRWSWSGKSADGKRVSVTLWKDEFTDGGKNYVVAHKPTDKWVGTPGHIEMIENLKWSQDHCDGEFFVIIAAAKDVNASPRSIAECYPSNIRMRLQSLDRLTGDFVARLIEPAKSD